MEICLCGKEFEKFNRSFASHRKRCKIYLESVGKIYKNPGGFKVGQKAWNSGLTKADPRVKDISEKASKALKGRPGRKLSMQERENMQIRAKLYFGGHTSKQRVKYVKKDGTIVSLHSSYEKAVAESLDTNNVLWTRPSSLKWIDEKGVSHRYYPDFFLNEFNIYLDPKNDFLIEKDQDKISRVRSQNSCIVLVLNSHELSWEIIRKKF
jgi:hypothetical protein